MRRPHAAGQQLGLRSAVNDPDEPIRIFACPRHDRLRIRIRVRSSDDYEGRPPSVLAWWDNRTVLGSQSTVSDPTGTVRRWTRKVGRKWDVRRQGF